MTPTDTFTIKANPALASHDAVRRYLEEIAANHPAARHYTGALRDVVNTQEEDVVELYDEPDMEGDFVSRTNGTRLLWMPEIGRAALNSYQSGDWQWTDASDPEDALRRYREDDMNP